MKYKVARLVQNRLLSRGPYLWLCFVKSSPVLVFLAASLMHEEQIDVPHLSQSLKHLVLVTLSRYAQRWIFGH